MSIKHLYDECSKLITSCFSFSLNCLTTLTLASANILDSKHVSSIPSNVFTSDTVSSVITSITSSFLVVVSIFVYYIIVGTPLIQRNMYIFTLKPTPKSIIWFDENGYDIKSMGAATSMLFAEVEPGAITRKINLILQVDEGADESGYKFYSNKIHLCDEPRISAKSIKQKELALFEHYLHEFRHWMQNRIYKISHTQLDYSKEDADKNRHAYFRNEHEVDARRFAKQHLAKFYKYYKAFKHV